LCHPFSLGLDGRNKACIGGRDWSTYPRSHTSGSKVRWSDFHYHLNSITDFSVPQEKGDYTDSFTSRLLQREDGEPPTAEEENTIKWCAGGLYAGAGDTVRSHPASI